MLMSSLIDTRSNMWSTLAFDIDGLFLAYQFSDEMWPLGETYFIPEFWTLLHIIYRRLLADYMPHRTGTSMLLILWYSQMYTYPISVLYLYTFKCQTYDQWTMGHHLITYCWCFKCLKEKVLWYMQMPSVMPIYMHQNKFYLRDF